MNRNMIIKKNQPLYEVMPITDLKDLVYKCAERYKEKNAFLVKENGVYTGISFNKFLKDVKSCAAAIDDMGLMGSFTAVIGENCYEWAVVYMAVTNCTGVIVPLDKDLPSEEVFTSLETCEAPVVFYTNKTAKLIDSVKDRLPKLRKFINMSSDFKELLAKGESLINNGNTVFDDSVIDTEEMRVLLFTSGTSAKSKAVMLSHKNITADLMSMSSMLYIDPSDIFLSVLPLHHTYECTCGFLCPFYRGATVAYCEGLRHITTNMKEAKATVMLGVPLLFEGMYKKIQQQAEKSGIDGKMKTAIKVSNILRKFGINITKKLFAKVHSNLGGSMSLLISGAAPINPEVIKWFRDIGFCFLQGYGLTECSPIVALNRDVDFRDAAAGLPLPVNEVRIESKNVEGIGEVIVKGDNVMMGYYKNPEATQAVMDNGWFKTGDLGYIDNDGFLYIRGRKKNVIVTKNGKNIYPEELETLLCNNKYIEDAMVFGETDKNGDLTVCVQVYPKLETIDEEKINPEKIEGLMIKAVKEVNENLPNYKKISKTIVRENEFVKTSSKKIKRYMN